MVIGNCFDDDWKFFFKSMNDEFKALNVKIDKVLLLTKPKPSSCNGLSLDELVQMMERGNVKIKMNDIEEKEACSIFRSNADACDDDEKKEVVIDDNLNHTVEEPELL